MTDRELMQQALDALEDVGGEWGFTSQRTLPKRMNAIEALRARLAQPEQEQTRSQKMRDAGITRRPKRWDKDGDDTEQEPVATLFGSLPVYDVPTEQEPVAWMYNSMGDTRFSKTLDTPGMHRDESVPLYTAPPQREWQGMTDEEIDDEYFDNWSISRMRDFARAIEAKLKGKNNG